MSNTRKRRSPAPAPVDDELEELVEIGTAVAVAVLPHFLGTAETPTIAAAESWGLASEFILFRQSWIEQLEERMDAPD